MSGQIVIKCTTERIRKFCRGEMLFSEMVNPQLQKPLPISEIDYWEYDLLYPGDYKITTDDIFAGIRNGIEKINQVPEDDTDLYISRVEEFFFDWFEPLYEKVGDMVFLPAALGYPEIKRMDDMWEVTPDGPMFFPRNLHQLAFKLMQDIDCDKDQWSYSEDDVPFLRNIINGYIFRIDQFDWNINHHTRDWKFDNEEAKYYIRYYRDEKKLETLGTTKQELYKRYLEQYCAEGDLEAIEIKGYFCYGDGNPLYDCNWETARDCMLEIFNRGSDEKKAMAANTLGYIYYYGRCNNFVPEYDKAYIYFSYASFFGYYEATYKVGDMLANGYGIAKNKQAAFKLYSSVYWDNYRRFQNGETKSVFSDAALRMGQAYHKGIGTTPNLIEAYKCYLQAKLAIDVRLKKTNFYGINKVKENIEKGLAAVKHDIIEDGSYKIDQNVCKLDPVPLLKVLKEGSPTVILTVEELDREYKFTFKRTPRGSFEVKNKCMITIPEMSYCERVDHLDFYAKKDINFHLTKNLDSVEFDRMEVAPDAIRFYKGMKRVAKIEYVEMKYIRPGN